MFRQLPNYLAKAPDGDLFSPALPDPRTLFDRHPLKIAAYMEAYWNKGRPQPRPLPPAVSPDPLGHPDHRSDEAGLPAARFPLQDDEVLFGFDEATRRRVRNGFLYWDHLIYAYMIENTRVYEVFRRVLHEYRHGEKLGTPLDAGTQNWLRNTEELFYSDSAPFLVTNVMSHIRPELRASRRNAYQRMFGMDLNHGTDDGKPYSYIRAEAANSDFVNTFEEFLREVWVGITYVGATASSNPTDDSKISELAEKLHDMLRSRRQNGNLSREEFAFVAMMSWFHLTLEFDESPVVKSLRAEATGLENRLFKIAERVGLPAHGLSKSFFDIADPISRLLIQIEMGTYNAGDAVRALYDRDSFPNGPESDMRTIITHWTAITGRDVKARKVAAN
jgi:transcriptional regulator with XRE-family HTH domain